MRLHTDVLVKADLENAAPPGVEVNIVLHGSRKRDHAYEVALRGYGARHNRRINSGQRGAGEEYAATYSDWGHWLAKLFEKDPSMTATYYKSEDDFHEQTGGLYRAPDRTRLLAEAVHTVMPIAGKAKAITTIATANDIDPWLLKRAIEGE